VERLLSAFDGAFGAPAAVALAAAFGWGVLSVALSPCHLSSVPLVVAYMSGGTELPAGRRALGLASAFALGILVSVGVVGAATAAAGRMLGDVGPIGTWLLALVFVLVGLDLLGLVSLPGLGRAPAESRRRGPTGALLLGLTFGVALGPCTFAFLAPLLAIALGAGGRGAAGQGVLLVAAFGLGHAVAIAGAGTSLQAVSRWLGSRGGARATRAVRAVAGVAVILGGVWFVWSAR